MKENKTVYRLREDQLSILCRQLCLMLQAGIGVEEGMSLIAADVEDGALRALLERVHGALAEGNTLSSALSGAEAFPDYMIRMVEIGQASGRLEQVLDALSLYYQREDEMGQNLRRAVVYPSVMALLIAIVFLVLVGRVMPVFQQVFSQLGTELSPLAKGLLSFGAAGQQVTAVLAVVLAAAAAALLWAFRSGKGAQLYGRVFAKSAAGQAVDRGRFASAMAMMLSSGLPLDEAMERTCHLLEGSTLTEQLHRCQSQMDEGVSFAKAAEGIFSGLEAGLLAAGSRAGLTDQAMEELARRCQNEASQRLEALLGRFEYALVITLCLAVGMVLLSVMLPLLGALSALGG